MLEKIITSKSKTFLVFCFCFLAGIALTSVLNKKIDFVYSSDLIRAISTAEEILHFHPSLNLVLTEEIRERCYGIYDGKHRDIYTTAARKEKVSYHAFKPEGGESIIEAKERARKFYSKLKEKHSSDTVLLVTHGGFIRALMAAILNESLKNGKYCNVRQLNTAVTIFNNGKLEIFNSTKHLE